MKHRMQRPKGGESAKAALRRRERERQARIDALVADGVPVEIATLMAYDPDLSREDAEAIARYEATCPL